jgi:quinol monooxygenase YgiN
LFVVTVCWKANSDHADEFAGCLRRQAQNSLLQEPNCLQFDVSVDPQDPTCYFLYEVYSSAADFDAHLASDHFLRFAAETKAMVVEKTVRTYHRISPNT